MYALTLVKNLFTLIIVMPLLSQASEGGLESTQPEVPTKEVISVAQEVELRSRVSSEAQRIRRAQTPVEKLSILKGLREFLNSIEPGSMQMDVDYGFLYVRRATLDVIGLLSDEQLVQLPNANVCQSFFQRFNDEYLDARGTHHVDPVLLEARGLIEAMGCRSPATTPAPSAAQKPKPQRR